MPSYCVQNETTRGVNHNDDTAVVASTSTRGVKACVRKEDVMAAISRKLSRNTANSRSPSSVNVTARWPREKRGMPNHFSNALTWWLTAPGVTFNSLAASLNAPRRDAASNALSMVKGGISYCLARMKSVSYMNLFHLYRTPPRENQFTGWHSSGRST